MRTNSGAGRALVAVYGIFALAATARASVQLLPNSTRLLWHTCCRHSRADLHRGNGDPGSGHPASRRVAIVAIIIELIGVLTIGTPSVVDPAAFPRATVWSVYGIGYGFVPLVLPILGLAWLWHTRAH